MMKEIIYFLQWQWRRFETWQRIWLFAAMCLGAAITSRPGTAQNVLYGIAAGVYIFFICKWVFWDGIHSAWDSYQKEKQQVVDIMKDSGTT